MSSPRCRSALVPVAILALGATLAVTLFACAPPWVVPHLANAGLAVASGLLIGMASGLGKGPRVVASVDPDLNGNPHRFSLSLGSESTRLEPGHTWIQLDHFKWVTRGIIEPPQSFAVHPDGTVDLNGESFHPADPAAASALEEQINRRHTAQPSPQKNASKTSTATRPAAHRVEFQVRLDPLGHFLITARRGSEQVETGARGLQHLITDGWMLRPSRLHLDPLQRYLEFDEARFECSAEGAAQFAELLNQRFAPAIGASSNAAIEIRENSAAATGFDIHFWILRAGTRFEIKGHLGQDKLDILQDHDRCDLLNPRVILRISPPYLYLRRRRPDGGEESIPGLPDIKYRSVTAAELQRILNHPLVRRDGVLTESAAATAPTQIVPEAPTAPSPPLPTPTTPKVVESTTKRPPPPAFPITPPEPVPAPGETSASVVQALAEIHQLFANRNPREINEGIFRQLAIRLPIPVQDVLLTLPRVFEDRRFEVLDFNGTEIASVLQLRSEAFYGFYLTHLGPDRVDLVYACHGTHIEWGTDKCAVQPTTGAETVEFRSAALLGLAQDASHHFVFVVESAYRAWIKPREADCAHAYAHFIDVTDWARQRETLPLIWPSS
ncbi:MAG: hypothetical protein JNK85_15555 [Verrucomicrobiales bacterium]|nr:hypothetical protein [Verrucomicrobiales bacterium]